jgi:hypothetical protein
LAQRRLVPERQESFVPVGGAVPKRVFCYKMVNFV